ncbi:DUF1993 family protein [Bradyrhizobium liaoningense]|uniref:DUF1993 family protein n=1 Tax=Bradyrhizobium liaoningense TaxID=43992 RepID=UPI001BA6F8FD|nr:DUF1993 family protein [Bradyrhizobium liaoningense]MBR0716523.1 DUF1993 family protein [Bradyrhizobium liaoningense]
MRLPIVRGWFSGDDYIRHLVLPDLFFHISNAHAILRHFGVNIGKRNYPGTSFSRTAVTTRRTARAEAFNVMIGHFSGAKLGVDPVERTGKS